MREPERCVLIDGRQDADAVAEAIWNAVASRLSLSEQGAAS